MRKNLALILVALLALTLALAVVGCGKKPAENASMESSTESTMPADTSMGMSSDTTMGGMAADTTHK